MIRSSVPSATPTAADASMPYQLGAAQAWLARARISPGAELAQLDAHGFGGIGQV